MVEVHTKIVAKILDVELVLEPLCRESKTELVICTYPSVLNKTISTDARGF